jgi:hypothetical protein
MTVQMLLGRRPRDPAYARFASFGGYKSAEARSAKAEGGDPDSVCHRETAAYGSRVSLTLARDDSRGTTEKDDGEG